MPRPHFAVATAVVLFGALLLSSLSPASAAGPVGAPWVVASTPTSITLDWPGGATGYRTYYAASYRAVLKGGASSKASSSSRVTIAKLKPDTMYCFQTARSHGANRSQRYCHSTMKTANRRSATKVGVATFNVCSQARGCGSWSRRENAVIKRITEAKVDVVNIQEGHGVVDRLAARLSPLGFTLASEYGSEAVFYRSAKLSAVTVPFTEPVCHVITIHPREDTGLWPKELPYTDASGNVWYFSEQTQSWDRDVEECTNVTTQVADAGGYGLGGNATTAWARLRVRKTGKAYVFVSAHLANGKSSGDAKQRAKQARKLAAKAIATAGRSPIVFGGDFNSHRNRPQDTPRLALAAAGFHDTYDSAARYTKNFINSYNGYQKRPVRGVKYGDHVDRVFVNAKTGADAWAVVAPLRGGKNVTPIASDHHLVRVTVLLP